MTPEGAYRPAPIELYRGPGVHVTSEMFTVAGRRFPVSELTDLQTARGPHDRLTVRAVIVTATGLAVIGAALGYAGGLYRLSAQAYLMLGVAAFVPLLLAVIGNRLRPPAYELWGRYDGTAQLLFSSDHERQFGQVTRALLRAREAGRLGQFGDPLASAGWDRGEPS
ncbi:DUF6232 family protein [Solwaraspora sp. WMMD1047]|uniref:DUF6232 family protein n=1 Tax=Solwaraspora sp. WMMD1047 TaxID=3016102 RepID=UPI002415EDCD|nr:DUF6232 family protein [Solwaraspora sp. WMMD1047]MDG4828932.1 DUF6232 family protein [Solwaraspora sp. WMMD1047]